jgi:3-oxoacyl-[acyl-carrier protein] reductase
MSNLDKTIALVTGASRGIGRATAVALANGGARVIIHYGRSASEAESLRKQIDAAGGDADIVLMGHSARSHRLTVRHKPHRPAIQS